MSEADYILSLLTIISGLAISHMIVAVHQLIDAGRKVKWNWLASVAAVYVAYIILYGCWISWSNFHRYSGPLPFYRFLLPVLSLSASVMLTRTVLPDHVPARGLDLGARYAKVCRFLWLTQFVNLLIYGVGNILRIGTGEQPPLHGLRDYLPVAIPFVVVIVLIVFPRRAVHAVLVPMLLTGLVAVTIVRPVG